MRTNLSLGHVGKGAHLLDEHNKAALKAMRQARDYPANTCSGSRHAALMAEQLIRRRHCQMLADQPQHCGESIAHTVAALWRARTKIERLRKLVQAVRDANRDAQCDGTFRLLTPGQERAWVALMAGLEGPNVRVEPGRSASARTRG